jgi:hypothetical protein
MKLRLRFTFILVLFLLTIQAQGQATPRSSVSERARAKGVHPAIDVTQQCSECHEAESQQWAASKHGPSMIKCLMCHGAVNLNFIPKPAPDRCLGCHGEIVRTLNAGAPTAGKTCFQCHAPHSLDPHVHQTGKKP